MMYCHNEQEGRLARRIFLDSLDQCERFPKYLMIEPVYACNARCVMCTIGQNHVSQNGARMSVEMFRNIAKQIEPYSSWVEMVTLVGRGESLLDDTLEEKIRILSDMGIKQIQLSTNGELLTEKRTLSLLESGLNDLRISIDSVRKEAYEKIRPGLHYGKVIENAERAIRIRDEKYPQVPIRIRAVKLPENLDEREEWMEFWMKRLSAQDTAQFMEYSEVEAGHEGDKSANWPCISVFSTMIIRADGGVDLCCVDMMSEVQLGNITKESILDIWQGEAFRKIRKMHLDCDRNRIPLCGRGCTLWGESK